MIHAATCSPKLKWASKKILVFPFFFRHLSVPINYNFNAFAMLKINMVCFFSITLSTFFDKGVLWYMHSENVIGLVPCTLCASRT